MRDFNFKSNYIVICIWKFNAFSSAKPPGIGFLKERLQEKFQEKFQKKSQERWKIPGKLMESVGKISGYIARKIALVT